MSRFDANASGTPVGPVVVGGVGGSGTRLIAEILRSEGYFLGSDLNKASDNLWFTLLFKRSEIITSTGGEFATLCDLFQKGMFGGSEFTTDQSSFVRRLAETSREQHDAQWLRARADTLLSQRDARPLGGRWGWKEPNTHVVLDRLAHSFVGMKYVFVSRHGLDMALSNNQNQARFWGPLILGEPFEDTPRYSLRYWCRVHQRVLAMGSEMGERFLLLKYDDICRGPEESISILCTFLGLADTRIPVRLFGLVNPPRSIGRHAGSNRSDFDEDDVAYVESLGYEIRCL